jgi:hypothetical protein
LTTFRKTAGEVWSLQHAGNQGSREVRPRSVDTELVGASDSDGEIAATPKSFSPVPGR